MAAQLNPCFLDGRRTRFSDEGVFFTQRMTRLEVINLSDTNITNRSHSPHG